MLSVFQLGRFVSPLKIAGTREIGGFRILRRSAKCTPRPNLKAARKKELDFDPNLFFIPLLRPDLTGHWFKVLQVPSQLYYRKVSLSVRIVRVWNWFTTSCVTSINSFQRELDSTWNYVSCELSSFQPANYDILSHLRYPQPLCIHCHT